MENIDSKQLIADLQLKNQELKEREQELEDQKEELQSQKEELTAAIEALALKNSSLTETLKQLRQRNQELDQVLYRASHDLKTPISSLQGLLDLLKNENLSQVQEKLHGHMQLKVKQMNDNLRSLTMLAEASFKEIEVEEVRLESLIKQLLEELHYLPNASIVKVVAEYNGHDTVATDKLIAYNILRCLLSNSIIFRDPNKPGLVRIIFDKNEREFIMEVTDDGEGISLTINNSIFNMFYRGSELSNGQGLGLYIVKTAVERMQGEVRWTSSPGKTTFQIILPCI